MQSRIYASHLMHDINFDQWKCRSKTCTNFGMYACGRHTVTKPSPFWTDSYAGENAT